MHGRPRRQQAPTRVIPPASHAGDALLAELRRLLEADPMIDEIGLLPGPVAVAHAAAAAESSPGFIRSEIPTVFVVCEHKLGERPPSTVLAVSTMPQLAFPARLTVIVSSMPDITQQVCAPPQ